MLFYKPRRGLWRVNVPNPCHIRITWVAVKIIVDKLRLKLGFNVDLMLI